MKRCQCPFAQDITSNDETPKDVIAELVNTMTPFSLIAYENRLSATLFNGDMNKTQRDCVRMFSTINLIYNTLLARKTPISYLAYALATTYHETAFTMQAIEEMGKGEGYDYGAPHPQTGQIYYGRGYPQLTWYENYQKAMSRVINIDTLKTGEIDFLNFPEQALIPFYSTQIILSGMSEGWFTGKSFSDYLDTSPPDYVNARRIINGTDKANTIAAYALEFEDAINLATGHQINRPPCQLGSKGSDVRELQLALNLPADGAFGTQTQSALIAFQQLQTLNDDGICGDATWQAIEREVYAL